MKMKSIISVVSLLLLFTIIGVSIGCSQTSAQNITENIPSSVSSYEYYDISAIHGDDDLEDIYYDVKQTYESQFNLLDINLRDVNNITDCDHKNIIIFNGKFDIDNIKNALEDDNYSKGEYRETEVWQNQQGSRMVVLMDDLVIFGHTEAVKAYIRVINGEEESLLDKSDVADVTGKVPDGLYIVCGNYETYDSVNTFSYSVKKKDSETLSITMIYKFNNASAAEDAVNEIEDDIDDSNFKNIDVKQDGEFLRVSGDIDISDYL